MSDTLLGIILVAGGVLVWRISYGAAGKAFTFTVTRTNDMDKRMSMHNRGLFPMLQLFIRLATAGAVFFGGWKLHRNMETASSSEQMFLGWPLAVIGLVFLILYYIEVVKKHGGWWDRRLSWKGHLGWMAAFVAVIPMLHLYAF